jgi:glycosyltransferase involved in cell wall biosynthesis
MYIPEIVDGGRGILVPPRDVDALHNAMKRLVDDPLLYRKLREGARNARVFFSAGLWADFFVLTCRRVKAGDWDALKNPANAPDIDRIPLE